MGDRCSQPATNAENNTTKRTLRMSCMVQACLFAA
jgi:hypothetical protein